MAARPTEVPPVGRAAPVGPSTEKHQPRLNSEYQSRRMTFEIHHFHTNSDVAVATVGWFTSLIFISDVGEMYSLIVMSTKLEESWWNGTKNVQC